MPGVIGIVLIASTKRFVGARVSTLLGMRFSLNSPDRKVVILITSLPASRSVIGDFTKLDPIRPSQLLASSLPRRGAEIKITRPISGRCRKMSASVVSLTRKTPSGSATVASSPGGYPPDSRLVGQANGPGAAVYRRMPRRCKGTA